MFQQFNGRSFFEMLQIDVALESNKILVFETFKLKMEILGKKKRIIIQRLNLHEICFPSLVVWWALDYL